MVYQIRLFKGLFRSNDQLYQLSQAKQIRGLWTKFFLLVLGSFLLSLTAGYLGIQGEQVSTYMSESGSSTYEWIKILFAGGAALWGLLFPLFYIFIPALLFWIFLEIDFKKLMALQCIALTLYLIEYALLIVWNILFSLPRDSSPFSLGVAAQYVIDNVIVIRFFSSITIFQVWMFVIQYRFLRISQVKGPRYIFLMVLLTGLAFWILSALFTSIHVDNLF